MTKISMIGDPRMVFLLVHIDQFNNLFPHIKISLLLSNPHLLLLKDVLTVGLCHRRKSEVINNDCNDSNVCKHNINSNSNLNDNTTCTPGIECKL